MRDTGAHAPAGAHAVTGTGTGLGGPADPAPAPRGHRPARPYQPELPVHTGDLTDPAVRGRLAAAVRTVDAPDVVLALSRDGRRALCSGGTAPRPPRPRELLRYETGSASKTYGALLLAALHHEGVVDLADLALPLLAPGRPPGAAPITLLHLATHTSGLPRLPADFYPGAARHRRTNPYAGYPAERLIDAFVRDRAHPADPARPGPPRLPRHRPGSRWRYSNFGAAVLGHALAAAAGDGAGWEELVADRVLGPLGLTGTALYPVGFATDALGRGRDGRTPVPPLLMGGFAPAGSVRATPDDLLRYLEAQLRPAGSPLEQALRTAQLPLLRRGLGHRHTHALGWFVHEGADGPIWFHCGASFGQQAFLGFRPATGTALAAVCTRRFRAGDPFIATAHALLAAPR